MPKKIDPEFEGVVRTLSELGHLPPAIIKILKKQNKVVISETAVRNIIKNIGQARQMTSQGLPPPTFKRKPKTLTTDVLKKVKDMMTQKNPLSHRDIARKAKIPFGSIGYAIHKLVSAVVVTSANNSNLGSPDPYLGQDSPGCHSPKNIEVVNCTICCLNIENCENPQGADISTSTTSVISQTICKLFGIQDDFESLALASTYCANCSSLILKIHKIWQDLDEAKLQLEDIIIKNAAGAAGNIILDQNSTDIARNEIIKRIIKPYPEAAVKSEDNGKDLNEVLNYDLPDWNLYDDDQDNYLENAEKTPEEKSSLGLDHNETGEFYFSLKTPVLKLTKLPQDLVNQLTQKNVHPKVIQNGIDIYLKKDQENRIISKRTKSSIVSSKKEFLCIKYGKSYNHKKDLKEHYALNHDNDSALRSRKQLPKDNSMSRQKEQSHLCHLCSKVLTTPFHLRRHLKSHSRKNIMCPMADCVKTFESNDDLQDHLNIHNNVKVHKCPEDQCDNVYYTKKQLATHLTLHGKLKGKFECTLCSSSFGFAKNLLSHKKTVHNYTESTELMCEICARVFSSRSRYSRHKFRAHKDSRKHNDEKKQCPFCRCWFRNDLKFERHKNIHRQLLALTDQIFSTDSV